MERRGGSAAILVVLVLVIAGMAAVAGYGVLSKPAKTTAGAKVHLPGIDQIVGIENDCRASVYPTGAMYRFEKCSGSDPVGWPPCSAVTYAVDPSGAPAGYQADVRLAVSELVAATGLRFRQVTSAPNVSISWDPSLYDPQPGTSGEAGVTAYRSSGDHATSASIRLSAHLRSGGLAGVGEEPVLLHELGHAVGLAHFDGPEVMNPYDRGFTNWQGGDLAGLTRLYHPASCR